MLTGQSKPLQDLPREFELLAARGSVDEHLQAASGLDLVVYFSASTEVVLQRASQQGVCVQCSYLGGGGFPQTTLCLFCIPLSMSLSQSQWLIE